MPALTLARHGVGCPDLSHANDLSDDLVADHEWCSGLSSGSILLFAVV